jgi:hypothetical protein
MKLNLKAILVIWLYLSINSLQAQNFQCIRAPNGQMNCQPDGRFQANQKQPYFKSALDSFMDRRGEEADREMRYAEAIQRARIESSNMALGNSQGSSGIERQQPPQKSNLQIFAEQIQSVLFKKMFAAATPSIVFPDVANSTLIIRHTIDCSIQNRNCTIPDYLGSEASVREKDYCIGSLSVVRRNKLNLVDHFYDKQGQFIAKPINTTHIGIQYSDSECIKLGLN